MYAHNVHQIIRMVSPLKKLSIYRIARFLITITELLRV